jgi:hypothetical protein
VQEFEKAFNFVKRKLQGRSLPNCCRLKPVSFVEAKIPLSESPHERVFFRSFYEATPLTKIAELSNDSPHAINSMLDFLLQTKSAEGIVEASLSSPEHEKEDSHACDIDDMALWVARWLEEDEWVTMPLYRRALEIALYMAGCSNSGKLHTVRELLKRGASCKDVQSLEGPAIPVIMAYLEGSELWIRQESEEGKDIRRQESAINKCNDWKKLLQELLSKGASRTTCFISDRGFCSPLHFAAVLSQFDMYFMETLLGGDEKHDAKVLNAPGCLLRTAHYVNMVPRSVPLASAAHPWTDLSPIDDENVRHILYAQHPVLHLFIASLYEDRLSVSEVSAVVSKLILAGADVNETGFVGCNMKSSILPSYIGDPLLYAVTQGMVIPAMALLGLNPQEYRDISTFRKELKVVEMLRRIMREPDGEWRDHIFMVPGKVSGPNARAPHTPPLPFVVENPLSLAILYEKADVVKELWKYQAIRRVFPPRLRCCIVKKLRDIEFRSNFYSGTLVGSLTNKRDRVVFPVALTPESRDPRKERYKVVDDLCSWLEGTYAEESLHRAVKLSPWAPSTKGDAHIISTLGKVIRLGLNLVSPVVGACITDTESLSYY